MRQVMIWNLCVLFAIGLAGTSSAGMMDALKGQAEEAKEAATETHEGMGMQGAESEKAIQAQEATKEEAGSMTGNMMDQVKEGAKEKVNETIDNIGK